MVIAVFFRIIERRFDVMAIRFERKRQRKAMTGNSHCISLE